MRLGIVACAVAVATTSAPLSAAQLSVFLDPVFGVTGVVSSSDSRHYDLAVTGGSFSGRFNDLLGATTANPDGELKFDMSVSGEIFPKIQFSGSFQDIGAPSGFAILVSLPIPTISGPVSYAMDGQIDNSAAIDILPAYGAYFGYSINGEPLASLGSGSLPPDNHVFSSSGTLDCVFVPGFCTTMGSGFAMTGPGDGEVTTISSTYDLDAVSQVPLPASLPLVLFATGSLVAMATRRRP